MCWLRIELWHEVYEEGRLSDLTPNIFGVTAAAQDTTASGWLRSPISDIRSSDLRIHPLAISALCIAQLPSTRNQHSFVA
jgi:hypothetical protein